MSRKDYLREHSNSGLRVGHKVKITRKADNREKGWNGVWSVYQDDAVGFLGTIAKDKGNSGFEIELQIDKRFRYDYPYFVLEKVETTPRKFKIGDVVFPKEESNDLSKVVDIIEGEMTYPGKWNSRQSAIYAVNSYVLECLESECLFLLPIRLEEKYELSDPKATKYHNINGEEVSLNRLCKESPEWAANVIHNLKEKNKELEKKIEELIKKNVRLQSLIDSQLFFEPTENPWEDDL